MIHCQRCPTEDAAMAEYKVREVNTDTGEGRFWYLCSVHLEEDYAPWLNVMRRRV